MRKKTTKKGASKPNTRIVEAVPVTEKSQKSLAAQLADQGNASLFLLSAIITVLNRHSAQFKDEVIGVLENAQPLDDADARAIATALDLVRRF